MPDWFEDLYGLDPNNNNSDDDQELDSQEDPDDDGLINIFEFLAGTDPTNADTDNDNIIDANEVNADGVSHLQKQMFGLVPELANTDDDGPLAAPMTDAIEIEGLTNPADSSSPNQFGAVSLTNNGEFLELPSLLEHTSESFVVAAWVKPNTMPAGDAVIVSRRTAADRFTFELGLRSGTTNARSYIRFTGESSDQEFIIEVDAADEDELGVPLNMWTHIAGQFNAEQRQLTLYKNGRRIERIDNILITDRPAISGVGPLLTRAGEGFNGLITELRIANAILTDQEVYLLYDTAARTVSTASGAVDIIFVIDVSASMGGPIDQVKANITDFVTQLESRNVDALIGGVRYSDTLDGGGSADTPPSGFGLTASADQFLSEWLDPLTLEGGGDLAEDALGGLTKALDGDDFSIFQFRNNAEKVFLLITDADLKDTEDGDTGALQSRANVIERLQNENVTVHVVGQPEFSFFGDDFAADVREIAMATEGLIFDINSDDFSPIFDTLSESISDSVGGQIPTDKIVSDYQFNDGGIHAEDFANPLELVAELAFCCYTHELSRRVAASIK